MKGRPSIGELLIDPSLKSLLMSLLIITVAISFFFQGIAMSIRGKEPYA
jgi:hypothetical protein